jgi:guanylate kinase
MEHEVDLSVELGKMKERPGMLIVFSGPSGVGKDTVLRKLIEICPGIEQCVTFTTRAPRPTEVDGVDYHFVSVAQFEGMIAQDGFLEYAKVHLDFYGTPASSAMRIRNHGKDAILKIDVQGGLAVKKKSPETVMIFIAPPSLDELERRLRSRYTDSEAAITKRLANAQLEIDCIPQYDYLVVNDDIDSTARKVCAIIQAEHARIIRDA